MTMRRQSHYTLPQVLERHWRDLLHATSISEYVFAANVREHHEGAPSGASHAIEWSPHPDTVTRMHRDAEKMNRWFRDDVHARFPVEALEAFIAAFPPDRRFVLQQELAARQDLLAVPIPRAAAGADAENLGRIARETGEAIIALSRLIDDGRIDIRDVDAAPSALQEISQAVAVLIEMRERIIRQVGNQPANTRKKNNRKDD